MNDRATLDLAELTDGAPLARSQARRLLAGCEGFREVVLDFAGIDFVGPAFADEAFRVFPRAHPEIDVIPINATPAVMATIERARRSRA